MKEYVLSLPSDILTEIGLDSTKKEKLEETHISEGEDNTVY